MLEKGSSVNPQILINLITQTAFGKPVLILREETERPEVVEEGIGFLAGTSEEKIFNYADKFLKDKTEYNKITKIPNPYGDGTTSQQIRDILKNVPG